MYPPHSLSLNSNSTSLPPLSLNLSSHLALSSPIWQQFTVDIQIALSLPDPRDQSSCPLLKQVLAGISRAHLSKGVQARVCLPITIPLIVRIQSAFNHSNNPDKVLFRTITYLPLFSFFRLGELLPNMAKQYHPSTHLSWGDVAIDDQASPSILRVNLK